LKRLFIKISVSFILTFLFIPVLHSQVVYEPVHSKVYDFLERLTVKGVIDFNSSIKPVTRREIAGFILKTDSSYLKLTELEKKELDFYLEEYADEIDIMIGRGNFTLPETDLFTSDGTGRWRMFRYRDPSFTFYADPILGYGINFIDGKNNSHRWNGAQLSGYYNNWGFSLKFRDNEESGSNIDFTKSFTPVPGINRTKTGKQSVQYDEVDAEVNYGWSNGVISAGKYKLNWGSGIGSQLILSDKAPSFPLIRFDFNPVSWLSFTYIHGWLHSGLIDSSSFRYGVVPGRNTYSQIEKFIAAHMLTFYIPGNVTLSVGESVVYSDHLEPIYLIPVMFFRAADHYLQKTGSNTGDNAQVFGDVYYRWEKIRTKFYSTLFIDELSLENLFKGGNLSAVAYTFGAETADPVVPNSLLTVEYSRLNPFVYMNSDLSQLYTSYGYQLGHWIGSNADQVFVKYTQWLLRGLSAGITGWYIRKGKKELPEEQYQLPYPDFLYGPKLTWLKIGLDVSYEIFHNTFLNASYSYSNLKDEDKTRTPEFMRGVKSFFSVGANYGF
jgi:hypothetical protein